jgi:hypothetical protein
VEFIPFGSKPSHSVGVNMKIFTKDNLDFLKRCEERARTTALFYVEIKEIIEDTRFWIGSPKYETTGCEIAIRRLDKLSKGNYNLYPKILHFIKNNYLKRLKELYGILIQFSQYYDGDPNFVEKIPKEVKNSHTEAIKEIEKIWNKLRKKI